MTEAADGRDERQHAIVAITNLSMSACYQPAAR
jgi:hypothetical protein